MKIQLFSDLHLECFRKAPQLGQISVHPDADVIVLAGDIDGGEYAFRFAYDLAMRYGKQVVFVPGNHEYYHEDFEQLSKKYKSSSRDGVHVLLDDTVIIEGVRFCGGTLWTDFELYRKSVRMPLKSTAFEIGNRYLNDFKLIREGERIFTAQRSAEQHSATRAYLSGVLDEPFEGKTVVVTHHAPHEKSIDIKYSPGSRALASPHKLPNENPSWQLNVCFASHLGDLVEKADVWVHGHVHDSFEYNIGKCRVYANPRGYPRQTYAGIEYENPKYNPSKLIEI